MSRNENELENAIGISFRKKNLLRQALTHSSYANEKGLGHEGCNERLEFLGDAVLELVSSRVIFEENPHMSEGEMTRFRASMVCEPALAAAARAFFLGDYLLLGKGEEATGGRERDSVVSDAMEAVIGAVYLDSGLEAADAFIRRFIFPSGKDPKPASDYKTILQEYVQSHSKESLTYEILSENGPDHDKTFEAGAFVGSREIGRGTGRSKKAAEQMAAFQALAAIDENKVNYVFEEH